MSVERGMAWGRPGPLDADGLVVHGDAEARAIVERCRRAGEELPPLGLLGGDLCRTLGGTADAARLCSSEAMQFRIDVGSALVDGRLHWFVAHLIARRRWWRGRAVAVMNAQWLGDWDLGPRSHPGDGLLDISDGTMPLGQRLQARKRVRTGSHLPHPGIETRRVAAWQTDFEQGLDVWLDGTKLGRTRTLSVRIEPEALTVVV